MTVEDRIRNHMHATPDAVPDVEVTSIVRAGRRRQRRNQVGAAVAGGVLALGGLFGVAQLVDGDAPTDLEVASEDADGAPSSADPTMDPTTDDAGSTAASEPASEGSGVAQSTMIAGPTQAVIGVDGGFAGFRVTANGIVAVRSADGLEWTEQPTTGLPDGTNIFNARIVEDSGTFVALFEGFAGGPAIETQTYLIATSENLVDWAAVDFDLELGDGVTGGFVSGLAAVNGQVVATVSVFPEGNDPMRVLLEAGILEEQDLESFCGWDESGPGEPIVLLTCNFDELDPEAEFEQSVLLEIRSGDPGYDVVRKALDEQSVEERPRTFVVAGPVAGPYTITEVDLELEFIEGVHATGDGFVLAGFDRTGPALLRSVDGAAWTSVPASDRAFDGPWFVSAEAALISGRAAGAELSLEILPASGTQWERRTVPLSTEIHDGWAEGRTGPAGTALLVQGSAVPYDELEGIPEGPVVVDSDGHQVIFDMRGSVTVIAADGTIVHEVEDWIGLIETQGAIEGVVRLEDGDATLVFLDPETGDPLVTVTEQEFTEAMEAQFTDSGSDSVGPIDPPPLAFALLFTADSGETWTELELPSELTGTTGGLTIVAVGDDEVLLEVFPGFDADVSVAPAGDATVSVAPAGDDSVAPADDATVSILRAETFGGSQYLRIPIPQP